MSKATQDFIEQLKRHDWWSMMSDDYRVVSSGEANYKRLKAIADSSIELSTIFDEMREYKLRGGDKPSFLE